MALLTGAACGSFESDVEPAALDGGATTPEAGPADIEAGAEAAVDASAGRCNPTAPFADALPQLVAPESQNAAWLTEDELVVLLSRNTPDASFDLYSARREFAVVERIDGFIDGSHTLRIEVLGRRSPDSRGR